ncbi:MAG: hypothetical protein KC482_16140 [Dehalococcoidia bacterium]|nr:hypothetical protein [Dehalococcoidia bacterium]MCA9844796.1 hypothetical protein [Dehalococcoidia bacterium]MCA9855087.1 hypothetical protein [Dehalococcoidia bacterium]
MGQVPMPKQLRSIPFMLVLMLVVAVGFAAVWKMRSPDAPSSPAVESFGLAAPPPTFEQLAARFSEPGALVAIGSYTEILGTRPGAVPKELEEQGIPGVAETLLTFAVDEYVAGEGPRELRLSWLGDPVHAFGLRLHQTLTLVAVPLAGDPGTYRAAFGYGNLQEKDGRVVYAFVADASSIDNEYLLDPPPFARGMTMAQFHQTLRDAAHERGLVVPQ